MNGLTWVDREKLGEDRWRALKATLLLESRESKRYAVGGDDGPRHLQLWQERGNSAGIPRYFALKQLGLRYEGSSCPAAGIPWSGPLLRQDQQAAVMQAEAMARRWGGVILQAKPGTGKTPMGTALARALGARTLIVVHKGYHLEHWRGDIVKFTGLPPERIGLIRGDKVELGAEFTLGVLDSIAEKEYGPAVWDYFGHVCSDEIHKHGATTYSKAMQRFTARYLTGLSATPDRADGMELAFEYQVGPVINPPVESVCLPTKVYAMSTGVDIPPRYLLRNQQTGEDKINLGGVVSFLAKNKQRTAALANVVRAAVSKGRHVLVFSHRLDHLKQFKNLLGGMAAMFLGGMDSDDLAEAVKVPVLLSTYQMAQDAMNVPRLDTLVIATPMVSLEQAIGRIQRPHPDKKEPLVVDPVDGGPIGTQMYLSRRAMYARLGIPDAE